MTDIRYTPVSGGQTFGNPGDLFTGAARSLNRATQGASTAFDTFRQGAIDARDQRTQDAIASLQGVQTLDEQQTLANQLNTPEALSDRFGGEIDANQFATALAGRRGDIQTGLDDAFTREQAQLSAQDRQIARDRTATAATFNSTLNNLFQSNPNATSNEFVQLASQANIPVNVTGDFIENIRQSSGQARQEATATKANQQAIKDRETIINRFDVTDDLAGFLDSSRTEAINAAADLEALGVSPTQINRLLNQSLDSEDDFEPGVIEDFIEALTR